jgi:hypothetical protein
MGQFGFMPLIKPRKSINAATMPENKFLIAYFLIA